MQWVPNTIAFGGVATENPKGKGRRASRRYQHPHRVRERGLLFVAISMNPQMLKTVKEIKISPKLEKSLKSPNSSPRHAVREDSPR